MFKNIVRLLMAVVLFAGAFAFVPQMSVAAIPEAIESIESDDAIEVTDLGNGYYTAKCQYRFYVDGTRRASVRIKHKARWIEEYGVKINWSTEVWRYDYWPNDGYDIGGPTAQNWGDFPTDWEEYGTASYAKYTYSSPEWNFSMSVFAADPGSFVCAAWLWP